MNIIIEEFTIKYREFDFINNRDSNVIRTITRAAACEREAKNKIMIQFPRCRIISCKPKETL